MIIDKSRAWRGCLCLSWWVGLLLGGCFGPAYPEGLPCSERQTCPPGQGCGVDGYCRITPVLDRDGSPGPGPTPGPMIDARGPDGSAGPSPDASPDARPAPQCPTCDDDATCVPEGEALVCVCNPGFDGDGLTCADIDECAGEAPAHDCDRDATCTNTPGGFTCACNAGFFGDGRACGRPRSCSDLLARDPAARTGRHVIDPDGDGPGAEIEVHCDMDREGGGWTLVFVSSDDAQNTWTFGARPLMTTDATPVGSLDAIQRDFKSPAYHALQFRDVLFVHAPSGVTAEYEGVDTGNRDFGSFLASIEYPVCSLALAGNGHELHRRHADVPGAPLRHGSLLQPRRPRGWRGDLPHFRGQQQPCVRPGLEPRQQRALPLR